MLKIAIFDGTFQTTAFIRRLIAGLQKEHKVYVLGFNEYLKNPVEGVTYVKLGSNQNKFQLAQTSLKLQQFSLKTILQLLKGDRKKLQEKNLHIQLKKIQPDIVHVQWPSILPWLEPYFNNSEFKVVLSQRGFHTNVRPFVNQYNFNYLKKCYSKLDGIHSVSKAISQVGKDIGLPKTSIDRVVYTGLDLDNLQISEKYERNEILKLLSVGRPHWKKGYNYALLACKSLLEKDISFHYTIVGAKDSEELLFMINDLGLKGKITLTGNIDQDLVYKMMKTSDLMLLPSLEEGIANVVIEAMALGLPVISTNCGGMDEAIENNKEGWIVPMRNAERIAESIQNFKKLSIYQVNHIRIAARKKVEMQHSIERMVTDMESLYLDVSKN